jgi:hypothetical protein
MRTHFTRIVLSLRGSGSLPPRRLSVGLDSAFKQAIPMEPLPYHPSAA